MAYHDPLFQLGLASICPRKFDKLIDIAEEPRKDFFIERNGIIFAGTHIIIDLYDAKRLDDIMYMEKCMKKCVEIAGATLLHIHLHHFTPNGGISGVAVLSESHMSVHTWPEKNFAAFDVFMCGESKPELVIEPLKEFFESGRCETTTFYRGKQ